MKSRQKFKMKNLGLFQVCLVWLLLVTGPGGLGVLGEANPGPEPGADAQSLWENFSRPQNFPKLISTTVKPVSQDGDKSGFWSKMASGSRVPDMPEDEPDNPEEAENSPIDLLSKFANFRAMQKYSQLVANKTSSTSASTLTSPMASPMTSQILTPDAENGVVRRMGSAADRRDDAELDDNSALKVQDVDIIDIDDDDDTDADSGRLVAQVTAVNVLSQVQRMQDEIQELNKQIEEENMRAKLKDLKKSMMEPEGMAYKNFTSRRGGAA